MATRMIRALPMSRSVTDPRSIFINAEGFRLAARLIASQHLADHITLTMAMVATSAFSLELYLKCQIARETGERAHGHDLEHLFLMLPPETQQRVRDYYDDALAGRKLRAESLTRGWHRVPLLEFDEALRLSSRAFDSARYFHERPSPWGWYATDILEGIREIILEAHPDWELRPIKEQIAVWAAEKRLRTLRAKSQKA
jgi:HEPN domain-containing protein